MTKWFTWLLLWGLTGSPIVSLLVILVLYWALDRFTFRWLPDPVQGFLRTRRATRLEETLAANPNDRRARLELADILVQQRRHKKAYETLRPNLEAGDEDAGTLFVLGAAARGSGRLDEAARLLQAVVSAKPDFRTGDAQLELARVSLDQKDLAGADSILAAYLTRRRSSVEGRVLRAKVKQSLGDPASAQRLKDEAWEEYRGMPGHQRRRERKFAWQAKPQRPIIYAAILAAALASFALLFGPRLRDSMESPAYEDRSIVQDDVP